MSNDKIPSIVYFRSRYAERRADHFANEQQRAAQDALDARGYEVVGGYGDPEFAAPFLGFMEPRPGWQLALDAAAQRAITDDRCSLIVLRSDGIGDGDPFLPDWKLLHDYARLDIRVAEFSLRGHPTDTPLTSAHRYFERFIDAERERQTGSIIELGRTDSRHEIVLRREPMRQVVHAYYANYDETPLHVRWQAYRTDINRKVHWPRAIDWERLTIPARSALHLHTFVQGDPQPQMKWWRFKVGEKRETRVGNVLLSPHNLLSPGVSVDWYPFEPEPLGSDDFRWEDAPAIETRQLAFRNWRKDELSQYEAICNSPEAMTYLGGQQSSSEVADDFEYFRELGSAGPTYWAVANRTDSRLLGFCGVLKIEEDDCLLAGSWEIGWRFSQVAQGQGIALEAAQAILHSAFSEWDISELVCRIHRDNRASRRLAERLGMRIDPSRVDEGQTDGDTLVVYRLNDDEYWRLGRGPSSLELIGSDHDLVQKAIDIVGSPNDVRR
ncbi:MAG: GNAT family N-acetyltransferase [Nitrobacter sp.]|uniref:GNAT family N-acetyltransferase n=1 Tax=Nitrobacter sp. TaxID=29420 RepID=UPI002629C38C|nr:GNAT family N-acetyltransferase [Nitrobacter sp.]MCV0386104.1 GNAT family N-acetyltransferase [Nitrobacter sp.]